MLKKLLCTLNVGHHWVAESDKDGNFRRRCRNCGRYDRRGAALAGRMGQGRHPAEPEEGIAGSFPAQPFQ